MNFEEKLLEKPVSELESLAKNYETDEKISAEVFRYSVIGFFATTFAFYVQKLMNIQSSVPHSYFLERIYQGTSLTSIIMGAASFIGAYWNGSRLHEIAKVLKHKKPIEIASERKEK